MKNLTASILFALISMNTSFSDTTLSYICTPDPDQASQDFKIDTMSFSVVQGAKSVSYVLGAFKTVPANPVLDMINQGTQLASDLDGTPASDASNDLMIAGQDDPNHMGMLLAMASVEPRSPGVRKTSIDVYSKTPQNQYLSSKEAHLLCAQSPQAK